MLDADLKAGETTGTCWGLQPSDWGFMCHVITAGE